jgi:hypothetical protein
VRAHDHRHLRRRRPALAVAAAAAAGDSLLAHRRHATANAATAVNAAMPPRLLPPCHRCRHRHARPQLKGSTPAASAFQLAWHPVLPFIAVAAEHGGVEVWGCDQGASWTAFAADFVELEVGGVP